MTGALLLQMVREYAGKIIASVAILGAVVVLLFAVMGVVSWVGALYLWVLVLVISFTHASVHDTGDEGDR